MPRNRTQVSVFERNVMRANGTTAMGMSVMQDNTGTYSLITWINDKRVYSASGILSSMLNVLMNQL